ncbi:hypothetical protein BH09PAT2_BH09PAT2_03860 [soil metagenome]
MLKILLGVDFVMAALFAWKFQYFPEQIPLFYSRPWGEPQIVDYWYIALLPVLMHIFYFINILLCKKIFPNQKIPQKIFTISTLIGIGLFSVIFIRIVLLVT